MLDRALNTPLVLLLHYFTPYAFQHALKHSRVKLVNQLKPQTAIVIENKGPYLFHRSQQNIHFQLETYQRRIQKRVKHLRWSVLRK